MKINYRIDDLELRLNDMPDVEPVLHSPFAEIVQWSSNSLRGSPLNRSAFLRVGS